MNVKSAPQRRCMHRIVFGLGTCLVFKACSTKSVLYVQFSGFDGLKSAPRVIGVTRKALPDTDSSMQPSSNVMETCSTSGVLATAMTMAVVCGVGVGLGLPSQANAEQLPPSIQEKAALDQKFKNAVRALDESRDFAEREADRKLSQTTMLVSTMYEKEMGIVGQKFQMEAKSILETKKNELEANSKLRTNPIGHSEKDIADQMAIQRASEAMKRITAEKRQKEQELEMMRRVSLDSAKVERVRAYREAEEMSTQGKRQNFLDKQEAIANMPKTEVPPW